MRDFFICFTIADKFFGILDFLINKLLHYTILCNIIRPTVYDTAYIAELPFSEYYLERTVLCLYSHETNWNIMKETF